MSEELNRPLGLWSEFSGMGPHHTQHLPAWEDAEPGYLPQDVPSEAPVDPEPEGEPRDWEPDPMPPSLTGRRTLKKPEPPKMPLSPQQKLLLLDTWQRIPTRDFGALVNISRHTLYS